MYFLLQRKFNALMDMRVSVSVYTWHKHLVVGQKLQNIILSIAYYTFSLNDCKFKQFLLNLKNSLTIDKDFSKWVQTFATFFNGHENMWEWNSLLSYNRFYWEITESLKIILVVLARTHIICSYGLLLAKTQKLFFLKIFKTIVRILLATYCPLNLK